MLVFLFPWAAALLPAPFLVWWLFPTARKDEGRIRVPFFARLGSTSGESGLPKSLANAAVPAITWVFLVAALARPQWLEPPIEKSIPTRDLLLLVDLSASMSHEDFKNASGEKINRLAAVQEVVEEFVAQREGDRVGLVVFGNAPFVQVPLTTDLQLCNQLLSETTVGMAGPRTAMGDAIGLGISLLEESETPDKTIIVLTDGNDTASSVPPVEASRVARDRDIKIHTIAVGDPESVGEEKIDEGTLREVASNTKGEFFVALDRDQLKTIYAKLDELETSEIKTISHQPRSEMYFWPAAFAFGISLLSALSKVLSAGRSIHKAGNDGVRLKVNSRTFDLEAIER